MLQVLQAVNQHGEGKVILAQLKTARHHTLVSSLEQLAQQAHDPDLQLAAKALLPLVQHS